jgi:hypothetical protein
MTGAASTAALLALLLLPAPALAQVDVGVEAVRDRALWHFDGPSNIDTEALVPHFFEQDYTLDNVRITVTAGYRAGVRWRTTVAATPMRADTATDYDTFFDPGDVVWVAGTTGDARMHSVLLGQELDVARAGPLVVTAGYRFRLDLADFLEGYRTVTRNGVLVDESVVTSPEFTNGQTHEVYAGVSMLRDIGPAWRLHVAGDVAPAAVNRLAIRLPEKYPGVTLVYRATNLTAAGRAEFVRETGPWRFTFSVRAGTTWNYDADNRLDRSTLGAGVGVGRAW